jgi:hypothetical protein
MLEVFREVEAATVALEWEGLGFMFPVPGMFAKHWDPVPLPRNIAVVRDRYARALAAAVKARDSSTPDGRCHVDYWIGRLEFGIGYFDVVEAYRRAALADKQARRSDALREAQAALDLARTAIEAYARVAGDQSDRGAIAIMNEYAYRPLKAKVSELQR